MPLVDRVKNIVLTPIDEWPVIAGEAPTAQSLYTGYILILAAIGPLALALRGGIFGMRLGIALAMYVVHVGMTWLVAWVVDALAPTFGGEKNFIQSLKLTAYAYTASWIAGIFQLLGVFAGIIGLLAGLYSFYTFYLGVPTMKKCPQDKAAGYTIVVVLCGIVLSVVLGGMLISMVAGTALLGLGAAGLFH
jgi:hypothetical protein